MGDHAGPGGDQPEVQEAGAEEGAHNSDSPHAQNVDQEGIQGFPGSLEHALDHDGDAVEGLRHGHHPEHGAAQSDDGHVLAEQADHGGGEPEEKASGEDHERNLQCQDHPGHIPAQLLVPGADGVSRQGGGSGLHAVAGNVEGGFHGVGDGVGRGGKLSQGVDHGGEGHVAEAGDEALEHVGQGDPQAGKENARIRLQGAAPGGDHGMGVQGQGDGGAAEDKGGGACQGGSCHPETGSPYREGTAEQTDLPGLIDQEEVQHHIDQVHQDADPHGGFRVPGGTEHGAEDYAGRPEEHGAVQDKEIPGGQVPEGGIGLHPDRDVAA